MDKEQEGCAPQAQTVEGQTAKAVRFACSAEERVHVPACIIFSLMLEEICVPPNIKKAEKIENCQGRVDSKLYCSLVQKALEDCRKA